METVTNNIEQVQENTGADNSAPVKKSKADLEKQKREKQALLEEERKVFEFRYSKLQELNTLERQYQALKATGATLDAFAFETKDFDNGYAKLEIVDSKGKRWNTSNQNLVSSLVEHLKSVIILKIDEQEGKILGFCF